MSRTDNELKGIHDLLKVERLEPLIHLDRARYLTPSRRKKKLNIIEKLKKENFKDINTLEYFVAVLLSSDFAILTDRLSENIENFIIFSTLLHRIHDAVKKGSYLSFLGSGLRSMGGAFRGGDESPTKFIDLTGALEQFRLASQRKLGKVGGNLLRGMGEKISGESTTLFRVIKRTVDGKNPFRKDLSESQRGGVDEKDFLMNGESPLMSPYSKKDRVLISVVHALLRNFRHGQVMEEGGKEFNPALHYIQYLLLYGFPQFDFGLKKPHEKKKKYSNSPLKGNHTININNNSGGMKSPEKMTTYRRKICYYDRIWCQGLGMYVFIDLPNTYTNEKEFLIRCDELEKNWEDLITFREKEVDLDSLTYWEVRYLRNTHLNNNGGKGRKKKISSNKKKNKQHHHHHEEEEEGEQGFDVLSSEDHDDRRILMSDIRRIKNELVRREEREIIFLDVYRTLNFYKEQNEKLRKKHQLREYELNKKHQQLVNKKNKNNNNIDDDDDMEIIEIDEDEEESINKRLKEEEEHNLNIHKKRKEKNMKRKPGDMKNGDEEIRYQFGGIPSSPITTTDDDEINNHNNHNIKNNNKQSNLEGVHRTFFGNGFEDSPTSLKESFGELDVMEFFNEFNNHDEKKKKKKKNEKKDDDRDEIFNDDVSSMNNLIDGNSIDSNNNNDDVENEETGESLMASSMYLTEMKSALSQSLLNEEISSSFANLRNITMNQKEEEELFKD